MNIALIQSASPIAYDPANPGRHDLDRCRELSAAEVDRAFGMIDRAAEGGAELIVTIEALNTVIRQDDTRYPFAEVAAPLDGELVARFSDSARRHHTHIVAGIYTTRNGRCYNSALLFDPAGELVEVFDKVHLPAGEGRLSPGDRYPVVETAVGRLGLLICWDLQFPEAAREVALGGADLIACPTWGWEKRYGLCRAYENGIWVAAAMGLPAAGEIWSFCDPSCVVDPMGEVVAEGPRNDRAIVHAEIDPSAEPAPQYGSGEITGWSSMRRIRISQRRPDTYRRTVEPRPGVFDRWE